MLTINSRGEPEYVYRVKLEDGKMTGFNSPAFKEETAGLSGNYEWVLREFKKRRTLPQNNSQWFYFTEIGKYTGDTPQKIKSLLDFKFLLVEEPNEKTGEIEKRVRGTSELNTIEHSNYMENIREWAKKFLGIKLPEPDSNWQMNFNE